MPSNLTQTLKKDIASGLFWNIIETASLHGFKLLVSVILARILEPSQFGIIGMLSMLMAISQAILDSGLGPALIQKKNATHQDYCSIFYFNLFTGIVLTLIIWLTAPMIAAFFDQPELVALSRFLSLNFFLNGFGLVHASILSKKMKFKDLFRINTLAAVLSGTIAVILAYRGGGIWSIALQSVLSTLFTVIFLWLFSSWRPTLIFSIESVKSMYSYGSRLLASDILSKVFENLYQTLIGKFYTASELGFYTNGRSMLNALVNITNGSLSRVLFPSFSKLQDDEYELRRGYQKTIRYAGFIHLPLMIGLFAIVDHLIPLLFTEKWLGSIPIIKLLFLVYLTYPLSVLNLNLLKVKGRSDLFLKVSILKKVFVIISIILTIRHGIIALIYGQIVNSIIDLFIYGYYSEKLIGYNTLDQLKDILPSLFSAVVMGAAMSLVKFLDIDNLIVIILCKGIIGIAAYYLISILINAPLVREVKNLATNLIKIHQTAKSKTT